MSYAIEILKEKLLEEVGKQRNAIDLTLNSPNKSLRPLYGDMSMDCANRIIHLEKALEVLGREIPKSTV